MIYLSGIFEFSMGGEGWTSEYMILKSYVLFILFPILCIYSHVRVFSEVYSILFTCRLYGNEIHPDKCRMLVPSIKKMTSLETLM